jgi:5-methylthioadenosine/S-adenosylhomocysteine deaminase
VSANPAPVPLALTGALLEDERIGLRCEEGRIAELGPTVKPRPGDQRIDADGAQLVAPLLNGHTHAAMTLFRGSGGDLGLMRWLRERVWPIEAKLEPEDVYWGTRLACLEMIRSGTTRFWDVYWHPLASARAVRDAGLRATVGGPLLDLGGDGARTRARARRDLEELAAGVPELGRAVAPHSIYAVSDGLLRWSAELAEEHDLPIQIHLAETEQEVIECLNRHGLRPAAYLDRLGLLGARTVLAHGVWLDRAELELIAERGATVVSNPVANLKLAVGAVFPYPAAREAGVALGLGTDGAGSNDSLDLFSDLKTFALIQKHEARDAAAIAAAEAWEIATGRRAPLLGAGTSLVAGAPADLLLLRRHAPELGLGELADDLVYSASGSIVDTTVVAGQVLMRGAEIEGSEEVLARAIERARGLGLG